MEVPDDIPFNSLEHCSYRYLQQLAKSLKLPSNVKKVYLIEMIYAKKFQSTEQLESIVTRIKEERRQTSKPRKTSTRKKKRVQGTEISSTSNHSPPTSTPDYCPPSGTVKKYKSILNPLIAKKTIESDRVLRSYNNRLRRNTKYSIMNINNTVVGVVKAQNSLSREVQESQFEWNVELQRYRPVRVADCVIEKQRSLETDYVLPQPRPIYVDVSETQRDFESGERHLVPASTSSSVSTVRERRLSGIYPLEPAKSCYQPLPGVGIRREDGRISKINAVVQKQNPETLLKNKMTQTTVQRRLIQKPIVVSMRNALRPKLRTVQDVVNYKIDGHFSNSSTESARESSTDREIVPRVITSKTFQETFENTTLAEKRDRLMKTRDYSIENANRQVQKSRTVVMPKTYTDKLYAIVSQRNAGNKIYAIENPRRIDNKIYAVENQTRHTGNTVHYATENQMKTDNKLHTTVNQTRNKEANIYHTDNANRSNNVGLQHRADNCDRQSELKTYAAKKYRNTIEKMHTVNLNKFYTSGCFFDDSKEELDSNATSNTNNATESFIDNIPEAAVDINQNSVTDVNMVRNTYAAEKHRNTVDSMYTVNSNNIEASEYVIDDSKEQFDSEMNANLNANNATETINLIDNKVNSNNIEASEYVMDDSKEQFDSEINATLNANDATESINLINNKSEDTVDINQNSLSNVNMDRNKMDYPNMSALTDVYPENRAEVISEALMKLSGNSTVYYHKKIRAEQVRTKRVSATFEMGAPTQNALPHISDVFRQVAEPHYKQYSQPLYVECPDDATQAKSTNGHLESIYNYKAADLEQPLNFHHLIGTTNTKCVYSTHTMTTAVARSATSPTQYNNSPVRDDQYKMESVSTSRLHDYIEIVEQERNDVTSDEVLQRSPKSDGTSVPSDLGADVTVGAGADSIEDALELISQDGDYMERIGMDVRMQCMLCEWAGPKSILEYHLGLEHPSDITPRASSCWCWSVPLGGARRGARALSECGGRVYVLHAACLGADRFRADITIIPKDDETDYFPKYGRLTVYNKMTGEPHIWEGVIIDLPESADENETKGLNVDLSSLDLLPNSANLKLVNGEWVVNSTAKVVVGQLELNDIEVMVHVQVYD